jgi:hypothetical protein
MKQYIKAKMKRLDATALSLLAGVLSSLAASAILYYGASFYRSKSFTLVVLLALLVLSVTGLVVALALLHARAIPGLHRWGMDRSSADYSYHLLRGAQHSFEYMGATGSSVFLQSGRFLGLLAEKYESNRSFITRVLLMDPDGDKLIAYRRNAIGGDPNVCSKEDILSTIQLLKTTKERVVVDKTQTFEIRTYSNEIVWHLILVDRRIAVIGMYGPGASGWRWPFLVFKREPRSFYYAAEEQFDQRWRGSRTFSSLRRK